jgi:hypothetical protein
VSLFKALFNNVQDTLCVIKDREQSTPLTIDFWHSFNNYLKSILPFLPRISVDIPVDNCWSTKSIIDDEVSYR